MSETQHIQQQLEATQVRIKNLSQQLAAARDTARHIQAQLHDQFEQQQHHVAQLEANIQRLQWIINTSPATTYACLASPPYPCTFVSQSLELVLGYTPEELITEPNFWQQHLHPEDAPHVFAAHVQLFEQGKLQHDYRVRHRDGHYIWVRDHLVLLRDADGHPAEIVGFFNDVSDSKQGETQINHQLTAIEAAADGIAILKNGVYFYLNRAHLEIFGYTQAEELLGQSWTVLYGPEELARFEQEVMPALARNGVWMGEAVATRKDGTTFDERLSLTITEDGWLICVCADITVRKQAELALQRTNQELARATRLKDEFLANMSHELRTPLNAILGMTEALQEEVFGPITDSQRDSLTIVESSGSHLLSLINDILDVAKIEAGQVELDYGWVNVSQLCHASLDLVQPQAQQKRLCLDTQIPQALPNVYGDERRLRQLLVNLLSNAVKFTPYGGRITVTATYQPFSQKTAAPPPTSSHPQNTPGASVGTLTLAVADTGIGISPEDMEKLFQPFVQVNRSLNREYDGTGLGLVLVKRIAEMHGGQVNLTSELGLGSCFTIHLPLAAIPSA